MMNKALIILSLTLLASCGPSSEEKKNIAAVTCSIMNETGNMDGAIRVREMNDAREKIGGEPFLKGDDAIKEAFGYGLCEELVLHVENYDEIIKPLRDAAQERERIAAEKRAEENRIAEEKQRIADGIAAERMKIAEEKQRIADGIAAERKRVAEEKRVIAAERKRIAEERQLIADSTPTIKEEFYPNGKLKLRENYQSKNDGGKIHGIRESFHESGRLAEKANFKDGKRDGLHEEFHDNGLLSFKGSFIDGRAEGNYETYYPTGELFVKGQYVDDLQDGFQDEYYKNGQYKARATYKDGIKHGIWELYSNRGQLERTSCYQNDELVDVKYCNL